jgi:hypothetical protein
MTVISRTQAQENETSRDRFLNIYQQRLERRKHDCLEVLRTHGIRFTGDNPFVPLEPESTKILLPQRFVDLFGQFEPVVKIKGTEAPTNKLLPPLKTAGLLADYRFWRCATTATYVIPGIQNTAMPIDRCWLPLSTIALPLDNPPPQSPREELELYMATGKGKTGQENKYDAEWMGVGLRRVVIVGGPGSGKSLLLQRIAHREALAGCTVLLAKLKYVASEMNKKTALFEEALTSVTFAGFGCDENKKKAIMQDARLLLLDGLDECGGQRQAISEEIVKWSASHPETGIIITTRPVGHTPATLPQWPHYSLNTDSIYAHRFSEFALAGVCREVFKDRQELIEQVEKRLQRVIHSDEWSDKDKDYKTIRGVPLLFSFVISLAVNGCNIPDHRMALYRDVIKLLARDDVHDRETEIKVDANESYIFLHHLAFLLMEDPVSDYDMLMEKSGELFAVEFELKNAVARQAVERVFRFWEERRLLERLHHGAGDLVSFMHLGFCEYAAAKHLATLNPEDIRRWIVATRGDARWKEVYLNAAKFGLGKIIVETLLELDRPDPPDTNEAIFAAKLAAIAENIDEAVLQKLLHHIMQRITSAYPSRVCEAAESLLPLARKYPQLVGPQYKPLLNNEEEWTRYSALALCIEAGMEFVNPQMLRDSYPDLMPKSKFPNSPYPKTDLMSLREPYKLKTTVIIGSTKILVAEGVTPDLLEGIKRMYENNLSMNQVSDLTRTLKESGFPEVIKIAEEHEKNFWGKFKIPKLFDENEKSEQMRFLDLMLITCSLDEKNVISEGGRPLIHLAKIVIVLCLYEMPAGNFWETLLFQGKENQLQLAIRGAILAADVEPLELAQDILVIKEMLKEEGHHSFFGLLPDFPFAGDWANCSNMCATNSELLASAITHPCEAVAMAAAEIIFEGAITDQLKIVPESVRLQS